MNRHDLTAIGWHAACVGGHWSHCPVTGGDLNWGDQGQRSFDWEADHDRRCTWPLTTWHVDDDGVTHIARRAV